MIRILHFIYGLHIGGAETFIANTVENLNSGEFHFDFALQDSNITNKRLLRYISNNNAKVYVLPRFPFHVCSQYRILSRILETQHYDIVHIHINAALNPVPFLAAKKMPYAKFIVHSHNTSNNRGGFVGLALHKFNRRMLMPTSIIRVACSKLAGQWMFGKAEFHIINNAINPADYSFSMLGRKNIRELYSIPNDYVVLGSIGRLTPQKNHIFMLQVFKLFHSRNPKSKLLIVGEGPLLSELEDQVKEMTISNDVIFAGSQTATQSYYSAIDCFLMPSHFEGLAYTAVEAQANGLPLIASVNVTPESQIADNMMFAPPI